MIAAMIALFLLERVLILFEHRTLQKTRSPSACFLACLPVGTKPIPQNPQPILITFFSGRGPFLLSTLSTGVLIKSCSLTSCDN